MCHTWLMCLTLESQDSTLLHGTMTRLSTFANTYAEQATKQMMMNTNDSKPQSQEMGLASSAGTLICDKLWS